jgi:hypothetical protein
MYYFSFFDGGTGSDPPALSGWHFNIRLAANQQPFNTPKRLIASIV